MNDRFNFDYEGEAARWGISDFYEDFEELLVEKLKAGKPFCTGWVGVKKEPQSFCIELTEDDRCYIQVSVTMDDAPYLVDTAIWEAAGGNEVCNSGADWLEKNNYVADREIDDIIHGYLEGRNEFTDWEDAFCAPVYALVAQTLEQCADRADKRLSAIYNDLVDYMRFRYFEEREMEVEFGAPSNFDYKGDASKWEAAGFYINFADYFQEKLRDGKPFCTDWLIISERPTRFRIKLGRHKCHVLVESQLSAVDILQYYAGQGEVSEKLERLVRAVTAQELGATVLYEAAHGECFASETAIRHALRDAESIVDAAIAGARYTIIQKVNRGG